MFQTSGEDVTALGLNERLCHSDPCQHFLTDWLPETQRQSDFFFSLPEQTLILFWKVNDTVNLIGHFSAIMWVLKVM